MLDGNSFVDADKTHKILSQRQKTIIHNTASNMSMHLFASVFFASMSQRVSTDVHTLQVPLKESNPNHYTGQ